MKLLIDGQTLATPEIRRGIGVVFRSLCEHLIVNDISTDYFISVGAEADLRHFDPATRQRLTPVVVGPVLDRAEAERPGNFAARSAAYGQALAAAVTRLGIDAYWMPNPLMLNVLLPTTLRGIRIFATVHDLIPLVMREHYLDTWPVPIRSEYERRLRVLPDWADRLIFVSSTAKRDYQAVDGRAAAKGVVIPNAVDHTRIRPPLAPRRSEPARVVLFVGGFDVRKNMDKALEAFAHLVHADPAAHADLRFVVVCAYDPAEKRRYEHLADRLGVADRLVMTGYVDDDTLAELYREASVFFFPSRYEGFGIPVLEAMAWGVPVVCGDDSAPPEITAGLTLPCAVEDPADMARALAVALTAGREDAERRRRAIERAASFTWRGAAAAYFRLFTGTVLRRRQGPAARRRVGQVSPWPPQQSGIADYSAQLLPHLARHADVTLYLEPPAEAGDLPAGVTVERLDRLADDLPKLDAVVYHIGNNTDFHTEAYRLAWRHPGIVVLHDFNIHPFVARAFLGTAEEEFYAAALVEGYGEEGRRHYEVARLTGKYDVWGFPLSHALARRSRAIIVHNQWTKQQLEAHGIEHVHLIPHGATVRRETRAAARATLAEQFGLRDDGFLVASLGFATAPKRIPKILEAVRGLLDKGYPIQFVIGGQVIDDVAFEIARTVATLGLAGNVTVTGYLSDRDFDHLIEASDVIVNLRCPSMGESSGTLLKALAHGKPCIVSNYRQFMELPDSVCWKAGVDHLEVQQIVAYLEVLLREPQVRRAVADHARAFVETYSSFDYAAELYASVIAGSMEPRSVGNLDRAQAARPQYSTAIRAAGARA